MAELVFDDATGENTVHLHDTHEALAYILAAPGSDRWSTGDHLVSAIRGRHIVPGQEDTAFNDVPLVMAIDRALSALGEFDIGRRFNAVEMEAAAVYPGGFVSDLTWPARLAMSFDRLRRMYRHAARRGLAVLVDIY